MITSVSGAIVSPSGHTHTATTASRTTVVQINPNIQFYCNYFSRIDGQIKLLEILLCCIVLFITSQSYIYYGHGYETLITLSNFVILWDTVFIILYLFHVTEHFLQVPWFIIELISATFFGVLYFLCGLLFISNEFMHSQKNIMLLFVMTIVLAFVFLYDAYIKFRAVQGGQISLGRTVIRRTEVHVTESRY